MGFWLYFFIFIVIVIILILVLPAPWLTAIGNLLGGFISWLIQSVGHKLAEVGNATTTTITTVNSVNSVKTNG